MKRPVIPPVIGQIVLYNDGGDTPIPGIVTYVCDDNGRVDIKLFRTTRRSGLDEVTFIPYSDEGATASWSETQPF